MADTPAPPSSASPCPNCGAAAAGDYCPNCGQETSLALPTVRAFLREAAGRYVALDGRLWRTMTALLFRPGYLAAEYFAGRRRRYIRPARLFLVLSIALFALLRFSGDPILIEGELSKERAAADVANEDAGDEGGIGMQIDKDLNLRLDLDTGPWTNPLQERIVYFNRLSRQEKAEQVAGLVIAAILLH